MSDIDIITQKVLSYNPSADADLIRKAAEFCRHAHEGQNRLSGEPYYTHPFAVAGILATLEQDVPTICAGLLHDVIEDADISPEVITKEFGDVVLRLVQGVSKLGQISFASKEERQAENFRKMFIAMAQDIRIIIIKLSDRLHNMKTLKFLPLEKQIDISKETREIYAPLAHRLGMWSLKWELEDLAFSYLERDQYDQIKVLVSQKKEEREKYIDEFIKQVDASLTKVGIEAQIKGRSKHFYSIYNKLVQKNVEFDDIYDLVAIRVIVESVKDCYAVLGVVHSMWKPIPGRFRDFIALPKSNGYQTLHTTVMGSSGQPVEVQIRTKEMNRIAEYGIAAHWKYKEKGEGDKQFEQKLSWIRELLEQQKEVKDAKDFLENLKIDLFVDEVFVYSPKGDVYDLPAGSTPVDFAYHVHTQVGHRCTGAKSNGKIVPLDFKLRNGDIVEILTSNKENPRLDWLNFVMTGGARAKIKQWFKKLRKEDNILRGAEMVREELAKLGVADMDLAQKQEYPDLFESHNVGNFDDLCALIGQGEFSPYQAAKQMRIRLEKLRLVDAVEDDPLIIRPAGTRNKKSNNGIRVLGIENILTRFSKCCFPLPGDEIIGFITKGRGVSIHRADCKNITSYKDKSQKVIKVEWDDSSDAFYPVQVEIEAFDRVGVLKDILAQIAETKTNVGKIEVRTKRGSCAVLDIIVDIKNIEHLKNLFDSIKNVSDVYDVFRVTSGK